MESGPARQETARATSQLTAFRWPVSTVAVIGYDLLRLCHALFAVLAAAAHVANATEIRVAHALSDDSHVGRALVKAADRLRRVDCDPGERWRISYRLEKVIAPVAENAGLPLWIETTTELSRLRLVTK
jgi:hypothetical protein